MNKKEVAEIRRQYVPERCTISRICGCYVDAEKNIKTTMKEAFLSLPEDDAFKYFTIFKKTLSGTVGLAHCAGGGADYERAHLLPDRICG